MQAAKKLAVEQSEMELFAAQIKLNENISALELNQKKIEQRLIKQTRTIDIYKKIFKEQLDRYSRATLDFDVLINTQTQLHNLERSIEETKQIQGKNKIILWELRGCLPKFVHSLVKSKSPS